MTDNFTGNMIRVGTVTDIRAETREVRVYFPDKKIVSGWLKVVKNSPFIPEKDVPQRTEEAEEHAHEVKISPYLPKVGENVLCVFYPIPDGDGFVIGGV